MGALGGIAGYALIAVAFGVAGGIFAWLAFVGRLGAWPAGL